MTAKQFNFDRCLKFVFTGGSLGKERDPDTGAMVPVKFVVEYNPKKAEYLCPKLEAKIIDTPASTLKNRPGYEAELKIYNPNHDLLSVISSGIQYINKANTVYSYYDSKVKVSVYAGYYADEPGGLDKKEKVPKKSKSQNLVVNDATAKQDGATYGEPLFSGFVNNSILVHKGPDNILTLACHDIDMTANQFNQIKIGLKKVKDIPVWSKEMEDKRYKPNKNTFDASFKWLIRHLSTDYYPESSRRVEGMSPIKVEIPAPMNRDTMSPWFEVFYVSSLSAFETAAQTLDGLETTRSFWDENLRVKAIDPSVLNKLKCNGFYTLKSFLPDALNELCAFSGENLGFQKYEMYGVTIFCVYRRGNRKNTVSLNTGGVVKVINFQNLLDTPTVAPNGSMSVNMWFNRDCKCWKYIALVLDSTYTGDVEHTGVLNINNLNFLQNPETGKLIVPLGGSTSNAAIATTQLSTSMPVAAAAAFQQVAAKEGYMFNTGFLMTKVTHKLSTHGKDWSTTVQTVPLMMGVKND